MIKLKHNSTNYVIDKDQLTTFLNQNGMTYALYAEFKVREKLGQKFTGFDDFKKFKATKYDYNNKPQHLRFEMCGQRDWDGGIEENRAIFKMFDLPITLRSSYDYQDYNAGDSTNIFIFAKGSPILFKRQRDNNLIEELEFSGYGTVEILMRLLDKFGYGNLLEIELN